MLPQPSRLDVQVTSYEGPVIPLAAGESPGDSPWAGDQPGHR